MLRSTLLIAVTSAVSALELGCFADTSETLSNFVNNGSYIFQSIGYCQQVCDTTGHSYFALKGNNCWCGDAIPPISDMVDDSNCNIPCAGYVRQNCGGTHAFDVYLSGDTTAIESITSAYSAAATASATVSPSESTTILATATAVSSKSSSPSPSPSPSVLGSSAPATSAASSATATTTKTSSSAVIVPSATLTSTSASSGRKRKRRKTWTEENFRLKQLRQEENLPWSQIKKHFPDRTAGAIQIQYSTTLKGSAAKSSCMTPNDAADRNTTFSPNRGQYSLRSRRAVQRYSP